MLGFLNAREGLYDTVLQAHPVRNPEYAYLYVNVLCIQMGLTTFFSE